MSSEKLSGQLLAENNGHLLPDLVVPAGDVDSPAVPCPIQPGMPTEEPPAKRQKSETATVSTEVLPPPRARPPLLQPVQSVHPTLEQRTSAAHAAEVASLPRVVPGNLLAAGHGDSRTLLLPASSYPRQAVAASLAMGFPDLGTPLRTPSVHDQRAVVRDATGAAGEQPSTDAPSEGPQHSSQEEPQRQPLGSGLSSHNLLQQSLPQMSQAMELSIKMEPGRTGLEHPMVMPSMQAMVCVWGGREIAYCALASMRQKGAGLWKMM